MPHKSKSSESWIEWLWYEDEGVAEEQVGDRVLEDTLTLRLEWTAIVLSPKRPRTAALAPIARIFKDG